MLKEKKEQCGKCGVEINGNNLGDIIEAEEVLVCDSCSKKHRLYMIAELNGFRLSKEFNNNRIALRKKILWTSDKMGRWFDAGDKSYIESVSDYYDFNLFELQSDILESLVCILETFIYPDLEEDYSNKYPELERLRLEVREHQDKVLSYLERFK